MNSITIKTLLLLIFLTCQSVGFAQKKGEKALTAQLNSYELQEQDMGILGKQTFVTGKVTFKKGKKKLGTYGFIAPILKGQLSHLAIIDDKGEKIFPRIHYDQEGNCFTYYEGTDNEGKECDLGELDQKALITKGLLVWGTLTYQ